MMMNTNIIIDSLSLNHTFSSPHMQMQAFNRCLVMIVSFCHSTKMHKTNPIGTKRISRPQNGVILNEPIEIWHNHGFYLRTVVYGKSVLKGSQWVVFIPSVVAVCASKGPLVYTRIRFYRSVHKLHVSIRAQLDDTGRSAPAHP